MIELFSYYFGYKCAFERRIKLKWIWKAEFVQCNNINIRPGAPKTSVDRCCAASCRAAAPPRDSASMVERMLWRQVSALDWTRCILKEKGQQRSNTCTLAKCYQYCEQFLIREKRKISQRLLFYQAFPGRVLFAHIYGLLSRESTLFKNLDLSGRIKTSPQQTPNHFLDYNCVKIEPNHLSRLSNYIHPTLVWGGWGSPHNCNHISGEGKSKWQQNNVDMLFETFQHLKGPLLAFNSYRC